MCQNIHNTYEKFSESIAQGDASDAISQAKAYGQPTGSTIYFSVDYDASASEIDGNIKSYFQKLKSILSLAGYTPGVYGSSLTCKKLKKAGIVDYTWLSMSPPMDSVSHGLIGISSSHMRSLSAESSVIQMKQIHLLQWVLGK